MFRTSERYNTEERMLCIMRNWQKEKERFMRNGQDKRVRTKPILSTEHNYYVEDVGEVSWKDLKDLVSKGDIEPQSRVFVGRRSEWISADQIPGLFKKKNQFSKKKLGALLIVIGTIGLLISLNMSTSVSTSLGYEVENIGLLTRQQNFIIISGLIIIIGVLLQIFSNSSNGSSNVLAQLEVDHPQDGRGD